MAGGGYWDESAFSVGMSDILGVIDLVISGGAAGADTLAIAWAEARGIHYAEVPALWSFYKRSAGMLRNKAMMFLQPDLVVAFPGGRGTQGMVDLAKRAGIPVHIPYG